MDCGVLNVKSKWWHFTSKMWFRASVNIDWHSLSLKKESTTKLKVTHALTSTGGDFVKMCHSHLSFEAVSLCLSRDQALCWNISMLYLLNPAAITDTHPVHLSVSFSLCLSVPSSLTHPLSEETLACLIRAPRLGCHSALVAMVSVRTDRHNAK